MPELKSIVGVQSGNAGVLARERSDAVRLPEHFVPEPAKAEIGEQVRRQRRSRSRRRSSGFASPTCRRRRWWCRRHRDPSRRAQPECAGRNHPKLLQAVAAEEVQFVGRVMIDAGVEGVVIELHSAGSRKVRLIGAAGDVGQRDQLRADSVPAPRAGSPESRCPANCVRVAGVAPLRDRKC